MKTLISFSNPDLAKALIKKIHKRARGLPEVRLMEVCGTHTMEIGRLGLRSLLPDNVKLISGPGCPVCVTPEYIIDSAVNYAMQPGYTLLSFGDMIRVPGTKGSLEHAKANGGSLEIVTSPLQILDMAVQKPDHMFVFAAVGFETTVPVISRTVELAQERNLKNVKMLVAHRLLPPALTALCTDPDSNINGFLLPGHVSVILGSIAYKNIEALQVPAAITGFESIDILGGIFSVLEMIGENNIDVSNMYQRAVRPMGNPHAVALIDKIFRPVDALWRGIGTIPLSGLDLKDDYITFNAPLRSTESSSSMPEGCSCGNVLMGRMVPSECSLFGRSCIPESPVGPCMVSTEGSCAAYFRYERTSL